MINQSTLEQVSQDQINIVDNNIKYYKDKLNTLTLQYQQKQNELTQLTHEYTDEQIDILITQMKEKKQMLLNKVSQIQMIMNNIDNGGVIQEDKMEQYEKIYNNMLLKYKTIRKVCLNIIDQIADEMEMKSNKLSSFSVEKIRNLSFLFSLYFLLLAGVNVKIKKQPPFSVGIASTMTFSPFESLFFVSILCKRFFMANRTFSLSLFNKSYVIWKCSISSPDNSTSITLSLSVSNIIFYPLKYCKYSYFIILQGQVMCNK
jgi:hypothetical protein